MMTFLFIAGYLVVAGWTAYKATFFLGDAFEDDKMGADDWLIAAMFGLIWPVAILFGIVILIAKWFKRRQEQSRHEEHV